LRAWLQCDSAHTAPQRKESERCRSQQEGTDRDASSFLGLRGRLRNFRRRRVLEVEQWLNEGRVRRFRQSQRLVPALGAKPAAAQLGRPAGRFDPQCNLIDRARRELEQLALLQTAEFGNGEFPEIDDGFRRQRDLLHLIAHVLLPHPFDLDERLVDDPPEVSRPTSAKLSAEFQQSSVPDEEAETDGRGFLKWARKEDLYITNAGNSDPQNRGFRYCTFCGRIEPNGWGGDNSELTGNSHTKPYPEHRGGPGGHICQSTTAIKTTTLGTKFRSDVVLFRFKLGNGLRLPPGWTSTRICLGTLANAMSATIVRLLEIERGNVGGEYRPALTPGGETGDEVDVYLYDITAAEQVSCNQLRVMRGHS